MSSVSVLVEIKKKQSEAFAMHRAALHSEVESTHQAESLVAKLTGLGLEVLGDYAPVPMFSKKARQDSGAGLAAFALHAATETSESADVSAESVVIACEIDRAKVDELKTKPNVKVWPNSRLTLHSNRSESTCPNCREKMDAEQSDAWRSVFDQARSAGSRVDCRPYRPAASQEEIRDLLGVRRIWQDGFRGQNIIVGILDEGVNGDEYPVVGGFSRPNATQPGSASIRSHGSMCAADILVAAPAAKIYDYPFLGIPDSGGALAMMQAVLNQRQLDGTPQITNNSYGFVGRPSKDRFPDHEVWDIDHPYNRKVAEVVESGCSCFFSAGNCGENCPDGRCHASGIGPEKSIHAANSLQEVITVAAVNSRHERIGYSSQGPGGFASQKPDLSGYSHFFGNFGPGRPAGGSKADFDSGTSAACPVVAGVGALLLNAFRDLTPDELKAVLLEGATELGPPGWDRDTGFGVVNAAVSYTILNRAPVGRATSRSRR
ncbi:MAG: hypothetical protein EA381_00440 [Planctomycetaceae bacterium]|nr:MAG: hypothetical protein EA381_00440 [Planctomycetaceae bacterium]